MIPNKLPQYPTLDPLWESRSCEFNVKLRLVNTAFFFFFLSLLFFSAPGVTATQNEHHSHRDISSSPLHHMLKEISINSSIQSAEMKAFGTVVSSADWL